MFHAHAHANANAHEWFDLAIVGAGPAGISLAVEARRSGIAPHRIAILEKGDAHAWAIRRFYPKAKAVTARYKGQAAACHGAMCIEDMDKADLLDYLGQTLRRHQLEIRLATPVHAIEGHAGGGREEAPGFLLRTDGPAIRARACAVAIGVLGRPNKPSYRIPPSLRRRVHYDLNREELAGRRVLVVGGGDSASEYCQHLLHRQSQVTLSYRRASFLRMNESNRRAISENEAAGTLRVLRASDVQELGTAPEGGVEVRFAQPGLGVLHVDHVVYALGGTTPQGFLQSTGIEVCAGKPKLTDACETNVPGLFLVGDLAAGRKGGSIISAFNSSARAARRLRTAYLR